jgi:mRNA-degrading endonuclease toxin of MazEF toxin-antitoxin module
MPNTCAANFDNLQTVPKGNLGDRITRLTTRKMREAGAAVSFALGFDDE